MSPDRTNVRGWVDVLSQHTEFEGRVPDVSTLRQGRWTQYHVLDGFATVITYLCRRGIIDANTVLLKLDL